MLVDFCHWSLQPSVSCDKPSSDGYEVQNLISSDPSARRKGFLAETFIKPPVNITFTFPCKVSIHQLFINPVVGAQKSTSVEIFTASNRIMSSWLGHVGTLRPGSRERLFDSPFFLNIGKISSKEPSRACFTNPRFNATAPYSFDGTTLDGCQTSTLRNHRQQYLMAISQLTVRITQTSGSCVPALKSIEILGQPSLSNGHQILQTVYNRYLESITPIVAKPVEKTSETVDNGTGVKVDEGLEIPEDFLDPITWEMMALPMLLPCGKSLDQSTLERYVDNEASWGRRPNDPFTGVAFSAQLAPVLNETLKIRIDSFLLKHSNDLELKNVPRTVGRSVAMDMNHGKMSSNTRPSISNIINVVSAPGKKHLLTKHVHVPAAKRLKCDKVVEHSDSNYGNTEPGVSKVINIASAFGNQNIGSEHISADKISKVDKIVERVDSIHGNTGPSVSKQRKESMSTSPSMLSHESQLSSSLSQAMSVLSGLPSFRKPNSSRQAPVDKSCVCVGCCSRIHKSVPAYKLQCSHVICRKCLLQPGSSSASTVKCDRCDTSSLVSHVTRVHFV